MTTSPSRRVLFAGAIVTSALAGAAAVACGSFEAGADGSDASAEAAADAASADATDASTDMQATPFPACKLETGMTPRHAACADFDDGGTGDWQLDFQGTGSASVADGRFRATIAQEGFARLNLATPKTVQDFGKITLRFRLTPGDLNARFNVAQIEVGSSYQLVLMLDTTGFTVSSFSDTYMGQQLGASSADAGVTQTPLAIKLERDKPVDVSLVLTRTTGNSAATISFSGVDAGSAPATVHLETAHEIRARVGIVGHGASARGDGMIDIDDLKLVVE